jgi:hypothetical protein
MMMHLTSEPNIEIPLSVCELKLCLFTFATDKHLYTHFFYNLFLRKMLNFCSIFFRNALVDVEKKLEITSSIL